jgi:hypothetical protein
VEPFDEIGLSFDWTRRAAARPKSRIGSWSHEMTLWTGIVLAVTSLALSATPQVDAEIDQLLEVLKTSGCKFWRNGTWHDAPRAAQHLATKRDYYRRKDRIHSAEDFIRLAGSESSMSGKAYRVACPDKPEVDSKVWLETELRGIRAKASVP